MQPGVGGWLRGESRTRGEAYLADEEELVSELANQGGDVRNDGFLQQGEAPHDG